VTTIDKFFEEKNEWHQQPPQNSRMGREVVDEGYRYSGTARSKIFRAFVSPSHVPAFVIQKSL
jgi:hypothetical protein